MAPEDLISAERSADEIDAVAGPMQTEKPLTKKRKLDNSSSPGEERQKDVEICSASSKKREFKEGDHVVITYEGELFPGKVLKINRTNTVADIRMHAEKQEELEMA